MAKVYQDLLKDTSESKENGNYFLLTVTDLVPNTTYPIEFRWMYKDKSVNDNWSAVKLITTPGESEPDTPKFENENVDVSQPEKIIIKWDGTSDNSTTIANYDRIDVYIDGLPFDGTKAAYSFKAPGTAIIPAPAGTYQIVLYAVSKTGTLSPVSSAVTKTVTAIGDPVTDPEDPDTPTIKAGLASVIVSWNGKKSGGSDLATTGFAGAKVYIGTTSTFTPSDNNWVHTLNFANGSNQVSIGVGTVINKSTGAALAYGTPYYIKLGTLNASGATTGNYVVSEPTNITVSKLPASEISTGILSADASITAGAESGARVVMSGASSPFIIYGTNGTTKLLEFIGGSTGTLSINGGGTFTGNLSVGSGNSIFKAEPATGIWLGNATYASAPFSVSNNGVIKAESGTVGGWTLGSTYLQGTNLKLDKTGITVGATTSSYFDISPTSLTHRNSNGTASGKFTLTLGASPQLTIDGTLTVGGSAVATASDLSGYATDTELSTGLSGKISSGSAASDINSNTTTINGGKIATGQIASTGYSYSSGNFSSAGMEINLDNGVIRSPQFGIDSSGNAYFKGSITGSSGTFSGSLSGATITGATGTFGGVVKVGSATNYTQLSTNSYGQGSIDFIYGANSANIYYSASGWLQTLVSSPGNFSYINHQPTSIEVNSPVIYMYGRGEVNSSWGWGSYSTTPSDQTEGSTILSNSIHIRRSNGQVLWLHRYASSGTVELTRFIYNGSDSGGININGSSAAFRTPSDYRLKENIEDYNDSINRIKSIRLRSFNLKSDPDKKEIIGFVAHELSEVDPELVMGEKDAIDSDGNPEYQSIMSGNLVPYLAGALKEAILKIESLESRLDALEA
jgi:hypothetical protein